MSLLPPPPCLPLLPLALPVACLRYLTLGRYLLWPLGFHIHIYEDFVLTLWEGYPKDCIKGRCEYHPVYRRQGGLPTLEMNVEKVLENE